MCFVSLKICANTNGLLHSFSWSSFSAPLCRRSSDVLPAPGCTRISRWGLGGMCGSCACCRCRWRRPWAGRLLAWCGPQRNWSEKGREKKEDITLCMLLLVIWYIKFYELLNLKDVKSAILGICFKNVLNELHVRVLWICWAPYSRLLNFIFLLLQRQCKPIKR